MLQKGILNPAILSLLARVRHTNTLVIADRDFPNWPGLEIVDITLVSGIPTVSQVFEAIRGSFKIGAVFMAEEFKTHNNRQTVDVFLRMAGDIPVTFEPHADFKKRVPRAVGLIRTADPTIYANMILQSA